MRETFPSSISHDDVLRFRRLLRQKGKDRIDWNVWKYSYRKPKFQAITGTFRFLGFLDSINNVLTPLGRKFVFGNDDRAFLVGLTQSDYFTFYRSLLSDAQSEEKIFDQLSLECGYLREKERRSMFTTFIDFSSQTGLLNIEKGRVTLTPDGRQAIEQHSKVPLWIYELPLFDECRRIERFKALYYETGHPLRDIVKEAFSEIGFEAVNLPDKVSGIPDIKISADAFEAVVETKGENKQIGENDVNQLSKAQSRPEFRNKKLIFVGNAFRLKHPSQRDIAFHEDAVNLAESKEITLLSSLTLLHALQIKWKKKTLDLQLIVKNLSRNELCPSLV